jgi:hypothetical protein
MKKFLLSLAVALLACVGAHAQSVYTTNYTGNGTIVLLSFPANIQSITVAGTSAGAVTATLRDNSTGTITFTNAAYTSAQTYATNITSIITNSTGSLQTNTFSGYFTTTLSVAANTNNLPILGAYSAGASASTTYTANFNTVRGLIATMSTNATVTVVYRRLN